MQICHVRWSFGHPTLLALVDWVPQMHVQVGTDKEALRIRQAILDKQEGDRAVLCKEDGDQETFLRQCAPCHMSTSAVAFATGVWERLLPGLLWLLLRMYSIINMLMLCICTRAADLYKRRRHKGLSWAEAVADDDRLQHMTEADILEEFRSRVSLRQSADLFKQCLLCRRREPWTRATHCIKGMGQGWLENIIMRLFMKAVSGIQALCPIACAHGLQAADAVQHEAAHRDAVTYQARTPKGRRKGRSMFAVHSDAVNDETRAGQVALNGSHVLHEPRWRCILG